MPNQVGTSQVIRFATFEVDLQAQELRKAGLRLKLTGQPFQVLAILLEQPGVVVTREELQKRLWPDTFVDVDHNLNTAINKIREALGDSAENPRFVETMPRRGYRFIAPVDGRGEAEMPAASEATFASCADAGLGTRRLGLFKAGSYSIVAVGLVLVAGTIFLIHNRQRDVRFPKPRALTRLTFDDGLQIGATWSPDGRFIAYSSNRGGKFDIWVQQVSGGDAVQVTKGPGHHWQPDWSPDGKYIAYRSEEGNGGLYVVPALGGIERKVASFGYYPRWSRDSSHILFNSFFMTIAAKDRFYVVDLDGSAPREVSTDFIPHNRLSDYGPYAFSAAWHPDGKRISFWSAPYAVEPNFWTATIADGRAARLEIAPDIVEQIKEVAAAGGLEPPSQPVKFSWAPSGSGIYFEPTFRGARNIWKMSLDSNQLKAVALERITTGPGIDAQPSVSLDGKKLAFTTESRHIREWLFPFDAVLGRITGPGKPVTSLEGEAWRHNMSRDGKKLAFSRIRGGKQQLCEMLLSNGREAPILAEDSYVRDYPQWSPDGTKLVYFRSNPSTDEEQLMIWSSQSRTEEQLTSPRKVNQAPFDWSPDGKWILISGEGIGPPRPGVWRVPVSSGPTAETAAQQIISDPAYNIFHERFSPDNRWIAFEAIARPSLLRSTLYVTSASGGRWIRMTDGEWDDKPCWSPDGKTLYFVSRRGGISNVWGVHFDPANGKKIDEPFQVTSFEYPGPVVPNHLSRVELSITEDKLVINMEERSGSIWMLDNVDR